MKICIFGAGAIGGYLGVKLGLAGQDVTLIARGPHLAAIRRSGLKLRIDDQEHTPETAATDDPNEAGPQDYVIVTLKAHVVPAAADSMRPLFGPDTAVVFALNGIPWWYFYKLPGPWEDHRIQSVDPADRQWNAIGPERAVACVVYPACEVVEPGVIQHIYGNRFNVGEPDGTRSERCQVLSQALTEAGFVSRVRPDIRNEIWVKLLGNVSLSPVSVLTHATIGEIIEDPGTRPLVETLMKEMHAVAEKLGAKFPIDIETRMKGAMTVGAHKPSMLQDLERGRMLEIDPIITAVQELGRLVDQPTPIIDLINALTIQRARKAGLYPD